MAEREVSQSRLWTMSATRRGHTVIKDDGAACARDLLHKLDALRVVLCFDRLVVGEGLVRGRAPEELEAGSIECHGVLLAADVLDIDGVRLGSPVALPGAGDGVRIDVRVRLGAIRGGREVDKFGLHRVRSSVGRGHGRRICREYGL